MKKPERLTRKRLILIMSLFWLLTTVFQLANPYIRTVIVEKPYLAAKLEYFVFEDAKIDVAFHHEFNFSKGTFKSCILEFDGTWTTWLTFYSCNMEDCTISLKTHANIELVKSTIRNCIFKSPDETCVYINDGNTFDGTVQIIGAMYIYNNTSNIGLDHIQHTQP